jgi:hypothetical protein
MSIYCNLNINLLIINYSYMSTNTFLQGIDGETAKDFCWIHGSSYIPPEHQQHMKCIADHTGVERKEDAPDTSYYQWVMFVQLFQAGIFMMPPRMWIWLEGGLVASFGIEGKSVVMLTEEAR